jgi:hypothetical protein
MTGWTMTVAGKNQMKFSNKEYSRFRKYFPSGDDITLIVLKGHLLIEENMYELLAEQFERPRCLKQANLSFSKLRWVTEGLLYKPFDKWIWEAIGILNQARNELAHQLDTPKLQRLLEALFQIMKKEYPINGFFAHSKSNKKAELLRRAMCDIIFYLWCMEKNETSNDA